MDPIQKHQLVLWFDREQIDINELSRFIENGLSVSIQHTLGFSKAGYWALTFNGTLEEIDTAHFEVVKLFQKKDWNIFRLLDTAGDEIRRLAYSQLSGIEQDLRVFINQGLTDVYGFTWWVSLGSIEIPGLQDPSYRKSHHLLELMTIDELIDLVTLEKSEWNDDAGITVKDLKSILNSSQTFDEFRSTVAKRSQKMSLWNLVFEKYLGENASKWQEIREKDLKFIKELRNKVMHHRPVRLSELTILEEKRKRINHLIASAQTQLSEEEKQEINSYQKEARNIFAQMIYERSPQNTYYQLYVTIQKAMNDLTVRNLADEINSFVKIGTLTPKESLELQVLSFEKLEELTTYRINETQPIIIGELLPLCLLEDSELHFQYGAFRDILVGWIENHSQSDATALRNLVLDELLNRIGTEKHNPGCWTIAHLGYGREDVVQKLLEFAAHSDDQRGDEALGALTWLSITIDQRSEILNLIHSRVQQRYNNTLVWALARLGDPTSVSIIIDEWMEADKISRKGVDTSITFSAIREIADANDDDADLQDEIWRKASAIVDRDPQNSYMAFDIGHLVKVCNSSLVVPTILKWHGEHPEWSKNPAWWRYLAQERLEEAIKPFQLKGWALIDSPAAINLLKQDACQDSENDTYFQNERGMEKEAAWKTVLRAGYIDALNWFEPAASGETGRFLRKQVMNILSAFKIDPLPNVAFRWITEEFDDIPEGDGRESSYRMAAVQIAESLASMGSFEALLNFGYTDSGKIRQKSVDALARVSIALLEDGHINIIKTLVESATKIELKRKRIAAVYALSLISRFPEYADALKEFRELFFTMIQDTTREPWERENLLNIITYLPGDIPEEFEKDLVVFSQSRDDNHKRASLEALAYHNRLEFHPDLMHEILKLEREGDQWLLKIERLSYEWSPYIIGILYFRNPERYLQAISTIIEHSDGRSFTQIIGWLHQNNHENKNSISLEIRDALERRLLNKISSSYCETELFDILGTLFPEVLISSYVPNKVPEWMPEAKVALANALRKVKYSNEKQGQCFAILEYLIENGNYSVRRAAYRSIAAHSQQHLFKLCESYSESAILKLHLRAAEAYGWIDNIKDENGNDVCEKLKKKFYENEELKVREAAKRSWKERNHRKWGKEYLAKVLAVNGKDNKEILRAWRYGDALTRTGDDEIIEILFDYLKTKQISPNVHFWLLEQILQPLQQNWKKVTDKWPQPWFDSHGLIQRGEGKVRIDSKEDIEVEYSLWFNPATTPAEKYSWGGTLLTNLWQLMAARDHEIELELKNGQKGKIVLTGTIGNTTTFAGNGTYPA
jgi:hypothetical protein